MIEEILVWCMTVGAAVLFVVVGVLIIGYYFMGVVADRVEEKESELGDE